MVNVDSERILPLALSIIEYIERVRKVKTLEMQLSLMQNYAKPEVKFLGFVIKKGRWPLNTSVETMAKALHGEFWKLHTHSEEFSNEYATARLLVKACKIANNSDYGKRIVTLDKECVKMIDWFNEINLEL